MPYLHRFILVLAFCFTAELSYAIEINGTEYAPSIKATDGSELVLNGVGTRKATFIRIHVYNAALYLASKSNNAEQILQDPHEKQVIMTFVRSVDKEDIVEAWEDGFKKNNPDATNFEKELAGLLAATTDMQSGEALKITINSQGSSVIYPTGVTYSAASPAFGKAILKLWLGDYPPNEDLKTGMLGQ